LTGVTVNVSAPIQSALKELPGFAGMGLNLLAPVTNDQGYQRARGREKLGALLVERSAAYLLARYQGDLRQLQDALGGEAILEPVPEAALHSSRRFKHYQLVWSSIHSSLSAILTDWHGYEKMAASA
jgi:hypothetical protein